MSRSAQNVVNFLGITKEDISLVGEKGVAYGGMKNANFPIPNGFIITSNAYFSFIKENKLNLKIKHLLSTGNFDNLKSLHQISNHIRKLIEAGAFSEKFIKEVAISYRKMGEPCALIIPSISADNLDKATFVGDKQAYLNLKGDAVLLEKIKKVWSSLFDARAIFYRHQQKIDQTKIGIAIVVQELVEPDSSGVLFTVNSLTNDKSTIVIKAITRTKKIIDKVKENPDCYQVSRANYSITNKVISNSKQVITNEQIIKLAKLGNDIERHYYFPQEVEWVIKNNKLFIIQTKPITTIDLKPSIVFIKGVEGEIYEQPIKTATKLYVTISEPELTEKIPQNNIDGVGLLQAEHIITKFGIHPKKIIKDGKQQEFINKLSDDIAKCTKAFSSKVVIYRTSNLRSNDYQKLIGGNEYETHELNPIIGFRGAFRYVSDPEVFKLELKVVKKVREEMNIKNLWIMIPFVRNVDELIKIKKIINETGLERSSTFKLWIEIVLPSNVIMLEEFIKAGLDGVSIGLSELSTLTTGTDINNPEVALGFDSINPATLWALEQVIKTSQKNNITSSISIDLTTNSSELIKNLISWGITSISVLPGSIDTTRKIIYQAEKEYINR